MSDQYQAPLPTQDLNIYAEPPKKSNTTLIIVVVLVVLLCCCCIVFAGALYVLWTYGDQMLGISMEILPPLLA